MIHFESGFNRRPTSAAWIVGSTCWKCENTTLLWRGRSTWLAKGLVPEREQGIGQSLNTVSLALESKFLLEASSRMHGQKMVGWMGMNSHTSLKLYGVYIYRWIDTDVHCIFSFRRYFEPNKMQWINRQVGVKHFAQRPPRDRLWTSENWTRYAFGCDSYAAAPPPHRMYESREHNVYMLPFKHPTLWAMPLSRHRG